MQAQFPDKLSCLFERQWRYIVLYGGRGGAKSWNVARWLLITGAERQIRVLCARELMKSIAESVHRLLSEQITLLELDNCYSIEKARIIGANGTEFVFAGLKHDPGALKSYEGMDICWVEEAQNVSGHSWDILIPTIRKENSQIVITFNPDLEKSPTYQRFVVNPPANSRVVKVGYEDNPWFPDVLRREMEDCRSRDEDAFHHIWGGHPINIMAGAIYAAEMRAAESEGRICKVPYDHTRPVECFWDLGFGDKTCVWMVQSFPFEYRFIDYIEGVGQKIQWYLSQLQSKGYVYGNDWLPWDLGLHSTQMGSGRSIEELMRLAGRKVKILQKLPVIDGINAARTIFPQCWFDEKKCEDGLVALRTYRYGEIKTLGTPSREPLHDDASHAADALRYAAIGLRPPKKVAPPSERRPPAALSVWS